MTKEGFEDLCVQDWENVGTEHDPYYMCRKCPEETNNIEQED